MIVQDKRGDGSVGSFIDHVECGMGHKLHHVRLLLRAFTVEFDGKDRDVLVGDHLS